MTKTTKTEFKVPAQNLASLQERIAKVNKKVERLTKKGYQGVEPVVIEVGKPFAEKQTCPRCGSKPALSGCGLCEGSPLPDRVYYPVTLVAPKAPKVDGWEFVAALTHVDGVGAVLRVVPGAQVAEGELAQYREASSENCDHCHAKRRRTDTFIIRKVG